MEMIKIEFEFPREFHVRIGARSEEETATVTIDMAKLPVEALAALLHYGTQRKFNDKIGGADKTITDKVATVREMRERFYAGELRAPRAAAAGRPDWWKFARDIMRKQVGDRPAYKEAEDRAAYLDELLDSLPEEKMATVERVAKKRHDAAKAAEREARELDLGDL